MVLELVDKHGLEPCAARHVGSTPTHGTFETICGAFCIPAAFSTLMLENSGPEIIKNPAYFESGAL